MLRSNTILFLDAEIKREVPWPDQDRIEGIEYCDGWNDFVGMGIACVCAVEAKLWKVRPEVYPQVEIRGVRVFGPGNLDALSLVLARHAGIVTFNGLRFDIPLLAAHGIDLDPDVAHCDLARKIWDCAGVDPDEHPRGLGLGALCRANHLIGKTGHGAEAPRQWQRGEVGRVIDYCLQDCLATLELFRMARCFKRLSDPRGKCNPYPSIDMEQAFTGVFE